MPNSSPLPIDAKHALERGFTLMQPAKLDRHNVDQVHFKRTVPPLGYEERLADVQANLYALVRTIAGACPVPVFRETPLRVEIGLDDFAMTLVSPAVTELGDVRSIRIRPEPWQAALHDLLQVGFVPVGDPGQQPWFVTKANNTLEPVARKALCRHACEIYGIEPPSLH